MPWVYILRCGDNSLYVGHTSDLGSRVESHRIGLGASHTSLRLPVDLVYSEHHRSLMDARRRERQLKRWSAQKKAALIAGDFAAFVRWRNEEHRRRRRERGTSARSHQAIPVCESLLDRMFATARWLGRVLLNRRRTRIFQVQIARPRCPQDAGYSPCAGNRDHIRTWQRKCHYRTNCPIEHLSKRPAQRLNLCEFVRKKSSHALA